MKITWTIIGILPAKFLERPIYSAWRWKSFLQTTLWRTYHILPYKSSLFPSWKNIDQIKRMRWRTYFLNPLDCLKKQREIYNLISQNTRATNKILEPFEIDMLVLISKINFKNHIAISNPKSLKIKGIKNSKLL